MGFTVTPLAQKARTKTLIADSDLDLGNYDLIATDVKGDTAEFDEFVGGVGNFSNVLGSGNLDIEGTGNIKGLTTFQNAVQVNGALHVEGSINNVNIADNGEITTAQGVNGADFNGAIITASKFNGATIDSAGNISGGNITANDFIYTGGYKVINVSPSDIQLNNGAEMGTTLLPYVKGVKYSGTIGGQLYRGSAANIGYVRTYILKDSVWTSTEHKLEASGTEPFTITLNNIDMLWLYQYSGSIGSNPKSFVYLPLFT